MTPEQDEKFGSAANKTQLYSAEESITCCISGGYAKKLSLLRS
jgi:hypothetical protein